MSIPVVTLGIAYSSIAAMGPGIILLAIALLLVAFAVIAWGFINHFRQGLQLVHVYIAVISRFTCCGHDRFLMPLLPFWAFFFITGLERLVPRLKVFSSWS